MEPMGLSLTARLTRGSVADRCIPNVASTLYHRPEYDPAMGRVAGKPTSSRSTIPGAWTKPTSMCAANWFYLYRAVDKQGKTVESYLHPRRHRRQSPSSVRRSVATATRGGLPWDGFEPTHAALRRMA